MKLQFTSYIFITITICLVSVILLTDATTTTNASPPSAQLPLLLPPPSQLALIELINLFYHITAMSIKIHLQELIAPLEWQEFNSLLHRSPSRMVQVPSKNLNIVKTTLLQIVWKISKRQIQFEEIYHNSSFVFTNSYTLQKIA